MFIFHRNRYQQARVQLDSQLCLQQDFVNVYHDDSQYNQANFLSLRGDHDVRSASQSTLSIIVS